MKESITNSIMLYNTTESHKLPSDFLGRYHIHILCHAGKAQFSFMGNTYTMEAGDWVIWQMSSQISDALYSSDFNADFLLVDKDFLLEYNPEKVWASKAFVFIKKNPVFHIDERGKAMIEHNFIQIKRRIAEAHLFQKEILGRQLQIFLLDLWEIYKNAMENIQQTDNSSALLFTRFMNLLPEYSKTEREVTFYADKLCVSAKYLSEVVKKSSGHPASYWINGYAMQEILAYLKRSDLTLAEISNKMNFYNPAHFTRFVKKQTGDSPSELKIKINMEKK
nr:helix-turn-helix domain-containing protein [Prevotella sp.]